MATIRCNMASGIASHHPRTGLFVPGTMKDLEVKDWQIQELKDDHRVTVEGHDRGIPAGLPPEVVRANRKKSPNRVVAKPRKSDELSPDNKKEDKPRGRRSRSSRKDL